MRRKPRVTIWGHEFFCENMMIWYGRCRVHKRTLHDQEMFQMGKVTVVETVRPHPDYLRFACRAIVSFKQFTHRSQQSMSDSANSERKQSARLIETLIFTKSVNHFGI